MTDPPPQPEPQTPPASAASRRTRDVLYPNLYVWLIFAAAMDVLLTWTILEGFDGREVNPLAAWIIAVGGHRGMVVFKLAVMVGVIVVCEFIGRHEPRTGRRLAITAVLITAFPVVWSLTLLLTQLD